MTIDDEKAVSEITILPDGRIYVFGLSRQLLEVVQTFQADDPRVRCLQEHVQAQTYQPGALATGRGE